MANSTGFIDNGNIWGHPHAARALCEDGKIRKVRLNQSPDTAFSWSGRASIKGKTVRGFVYHGDGGTMRFTTYDPE